MLDLPEKQDNVSPKENVVSKLIRESHIGIDFYVFLTISTLITTIGLLLGNTSVIIGGMLLAPLLTPILALGLGIVTANQDSLLRSAIIILKSCLIVFGLSFITSFIIGISDPSNPEIIQRIRPSLPFMYIALLSGIGASYAWAKPKLSARLPGIAVVVALLPPLCTMGIGLSILNRAIITGSFQLFLVNLVGIATSSAVVFSLLGFHQMRWVEKKEIINEKVDEVQREINRRAKKIADRE